MKRTLDFGIGIPIPLAAATETFAIVAKRRVGKSNTAVVMAEAFYGAAIQFVAVDPKGDWYGVRADGPRLEGLKVVIFGGKHADVPLDPTEGAFIAELVVKHGVSAVLDVSEFDDREKSRFLTDFANRLLATNTNPLHLFLEEADDYIPQVLRFKEQGRCVAAFQKLVRQGGFRGVGVTAITHRCPALDKGILNQAETLIVHRTKAPKDVRTVGEWFEMQGSEGKEILKTVSRLANGEAWIVSHFLELDEPRRVQFPRRGTFDSGATPEVGARRKNATLTAVDIDAIRERMKESIERAKADDPEELRRRLGELERELQNVRIEKAIRIDSSSLELQVKALQEQLEYAKKKVSESHDRNTKALEAAIQKLNVSAARATFEKVETVANAMRVDLGSLEKLIETVMTDLRKPPLVIAHPTPPLRGLGAWLTPDEMRPSDAATLAKKHRSERQSLGGTNGEAKLPKGAREMLRQLVAMKKPLTVGELAALAGIPPKSSTMRTYRSLLRTKGYIEEEPDGRIDVTDAGFAIVGPVAGPKTATELYDYWARKLPQGARVMLRVLMDEHPHSLPRFELGRRAKIDPATSTYRTYMSMLKTRGLAESRGQDVQASAALFEGGR